MILTNWFMTTLMLFYSGLLFYATILLWPYLWCIVPFMLYLLSTALTLVGMHYCEHERDSTDVP